jgi:hypothetical protein
MARVAQQSVTDLPALRAALADPHGAAALVLDGPEFDLAEAIDLARPVALHGAEGGTVLRLRGTQAGLTVAAAGCALHGLTLAGGGRGRAALELRGAEGCRLEDVRLEGSEGVALRAAASPGLVLRGVSVRGSGLEAVVLRGCPGTSGDLVLADIGLHGRATGLDIQDCPGLALQVDAAFVTGSAVTLRGGGPAEGALAIHAASCLRALTVLGEADAPLCGLSASIDADAPGECGAMLVNAERITLLRLAVAGDAPALRLDGRHGARACLAVLHGEARVESRGGSRANRILRAPPPGAAASLRVAAAGVADTCRVCGWQGVFRQHSPLWRETFYCPNCRANLRYRAQAAALLDLHGQGRHASLRALAEAGGLAALAIYEPGITGPLRPHLARAGQYRQSVYAPGAAATHAGIEAQDLMACTHPDASFDLVVTSDILEHVRRPRQAFAEIRRILRPGGHHVFTIPTPVPLPPHSVARVDSSGETDIHLLPPAYHGSGDGGRSLVYTDFGEDLLADLAALGLPTRIVAYRPDGLALPALTFVSQRA